MGKLYLVNNAETAFSPFILRVKFIKKILAQVFFQITFQCLKKCCDDHIKAFGTSKTPPSFSSIALYNSLGSNGLKRSPTKILKDFKAKDRALSRVFWRTPLIEGAYFLATTMVGRREENLESLKPHTL